MFTSEPKPKQWTIILGESLCTLAASVSLAFYPLVLYIPLWCHGSKELVTSMHTLSTSVNKDRC